MITLMLEPEEAQFLLRAYLWATKGPRPMEAQDNARKSLTDKILALVPDVLASRL